MTVESLFSGPLRYLPSFIAIALLAWLTLSPDPMPSNKWTFWVGADKMAHALMFGGMTVVVLSDAFRRRRLNFFLLVLIICAGMGSGALIEILQRGMGLGRQAERADFYADAIGVAAASGAWILGRFSHK